MRECSHGNARALTENLAALLRREHDALAEFLVALADFDQPPAMGRAGAFVTLLFPAPRAPALQGRRPVPEGRGRAHPAGPGRRRAAQEGRLCLTSIIEAARVVTAENWETVLPRFYGLSRREAMEVVADLQPHPAPPTEVSSPRFVRVVRRPPRRRCRASPLRRPRSPSERPPSRARAQQRARSGPACFPAWLASEPTPSASAPVAPAPPLEVAPLTAEQSRLHVTVSREFMRKLEAAHDALSAAMPGRHARGDPGGGAGPAARAGGEAEGDGGEAPEAGPACEGRPHPGPGAA